MSALAALLVFYGVVMLIGVTTVGIVGLFAPEHWWEGVGGTLTQGIGLIAAGVTINVALVRRGWSTWDTLGWGSTGIPWDFGFGIAAGVVMAFGALAIVFAVGGAEIYLSGESFGRYLGKAVPYGVVLAVAALGEELVFRGYPLARLARSLGRGGASLALALVFAGAHLWNPDVSAFGLTNIALASLVLSAAFFGPGGIPTAWGLHLGWNGAFALVVDAPVSGVRFDLPAMEYEGGMHAWITGGAFGPEGGLATTVVMAVALMWFVRGAKRGEENAK